jgi:hypothetical protein
MVVEITQVTKSSQRPLLGVPHPNLALSSRWVGFKLANNPAGLSDYGYALKVVKILVHRCMPEGMRPLFVTGNLECYSPQTNGTMTETPNRIGLSLFFLAINLG